MTDCKILKLFAIASAAACLSVQATEVSDDEAMTAVGNWIRENPSLGEKVGKTALESKTVVAEDGESTYHVVKMAGGGFVVTSGDTEVDPFLAIGEGDDFIESAENPLWSLLQKDVAARTAAEKRSVVGSLLYSLSLTEPTKAEQTWAKYLAPQTLYGSKTNKIDDVCVSALVQSKWNQSRITNANGDSKLCYNYYTPNNYPCGCVATAMAQVMRYHCWPTNSIAAKTYSCEVDGVATNLTMQGGVYDWEDMLLVPSGADITATERQKIGKITSDAGISARMSYTSSGSGTTAIRACRRFNDLWGYAAAKHITFNSKFSNSDGHVKDVAMPCLAAGLPLVTAVPGHCVIADGYGYSDGNFYLHLNMGWGGTGNAWYLPSDIDDYNSIDEMVINAYPSFDAADCPAIFSGRIYETDGTASARNLEVTAVDLSDTNKVYTATALDSGVYALTVPAGTYFVKVDTFFATATNYVTVSETQGTRLTDSGAVIVEDPQLGNVRGVDLKLVAGRLAGGGTVDLDGGSFTGLVYSASNYSDGTFGNGAMIANGELMVESTRYFRPDGELWVSNATVTLPASDSAGQLNFNLQPGLVALHLLDGSVFNALSSRNDGYVGNDGSTSTGMVEVIDSVFNHPNEDFCLARGRGNGYLYGRDSTIDFGDKAVYLDYNGGGKAKIALTNCLFTAFSMRIGDGEAANVNSSAVIEFVGGTNLMSVISCAVTNGEDGVRLPVIPRVDVTFNGTTMKATRDIGDMLYDGGAYSSPVFHVGAGGLVLDTNGYDVGLKSPIDGGGTITVRGGGTLTLDTNVVYDVEFVYENGPVVIDPPLKPRVFSALDQSETKLTLAEKYRTTTRGRFVLATVAGDIIVRGEPLAVGDDASALFDSTGIGASCTVKVEASPAGEGYRQLALEIGDYANAPVMKVMMIGDSITHRSSKYSATDPSSAANHRLYLCDLLAAKGYRVKTVGFWNDHNYRATGLAGDSDYGWHVAFSGEQLITSMTANGNAGLRESLDNLLDAVDDTPDVVTMMIGTNDINNDYKSKDPTPLANVWSNLVAKLTVRYPAAEIFATSIIEMPTNYVARNTNAIRFNSMIAEIATNGAFNADQVHMLDLRSVLPRNDEDYLAASNLHPSWNGHAKLAEAWCAAITAAHDAGSPSGSEPEANVKTGVTENVPSDYRSAMKHLLTLRFTAQGRKNDEGGQGLYEIVWSNRNYNAATLLNRIGYYLELKRATQDHRRFVWADMDAWSADKNLGSMTVPFETSFQGYAANLHVASNVGAVHEIAPGVSGERAIVNFTYRAVETNKVDTLVAGHDGWYDWNVAIASSGNWGLMNLSRVFADGGENDSSTAETLFTVSGWNKKTSNLAYNEIGIGDCALNWRVTGDEGRRSLDYIWTGQDEEALNRINAKAYNIDDGGEMLLEIWGEVKPAFVVRIK